MLQGTKYAERQNILVL